MLRASMTAMLALIVLGVGVAGADDSNKQKDQGKDHLQATVTKVDADNNTVEVKTMDKNGKQENKTLQLSKDAKYMDSTGKESKLSSLKPGDDVCITQKDGKVTELRKHAEAKITKVDAKAGTITVKMADKDGKETEKVFRLVEDSEYLDSTGRLAVLDVFQSGDDILFVEADGKIKGMKKLDKDQTSTASKNSNQNQNKPNQK